MIDGDVGYINPVLPEALPKPGTPVEELIDWEDDDDEV